MDLDGAGADAEPSTDQPVVQPVGHAGQDLPLAPRKPVQPRLGAGLARQPLAHGLGAGPRLRTGQDLDHFVFPAGPFEIVDGTVEHGVGDAAGSGLGRIGNQRQPAGPRSHQPRHRLHESGLVADQRDICAAPRVGEFFRMFERFYMNVSTGKHEADRCSPLGIKIHYYDILCHHQSPEFPNLQDRYPIVAFADILGFIRR